MTSSPQLARLVRENRWTDLETAWSEWIHADPQLGPALECIAAAALKKELPRCLSLVREHAEALITSDNPGDAAKLVGQAMVLGAAPGELSSLFYGAAKAAWEGEEFWETYTSIAGLHENAPDMRIAWRDFYKLLRMEPEQVIYHSKGWGLGQILSVDHGKQEAKIKFASGRTDHFPFKTTMEIFEFLEPGDLRALLIKDPDELANLLKKEPLVVLRWILERNGGKCLQPTIKLAMSTLGVEAAKFTAWWRKAKKAAETDEWFELSGPTTKSQVRLLDEAADPTRAIQRQLKLAKNISEALQRVRSLVTGGVADEAVVTAALTTLDELCLDGNQPLAERLGAWVFLRDQLGESPDGLAKLFAEAAEMPVPEDPSKAPQVWALCQQIPGLREQDRAIDLLKEQLGDGWIDHVAKHLPHAAPGMVKSLIDTLSNNERVDDMIAHYKNLLARPTRNPILLIRLAEYIERKDFNDQLPPIQRRAQTLLQLAVHLTRTSTGNVALTRARTRLNDTLTKGDDPLLRKLLAKADVEELRSLGTMLEAGVDREIDKLFTRIAVEVSPDVFRGEDRPFWETAGTWTTSDGLARREAELRDLVEVKIPENSEAIGKAASFGDLSENSEWEAAIADQRTLTNRAMGLEKDIREAQLIENAGIPQDTVAPGTMVGYRDLSEKTEHTIEILGPWDVTREGQVSYRSPLAAGMLGHHTGEEATLVLPNETKQVKILSIASLEIA